MNLESIFKVILGMGLGDQRILATGQVQGKWDGSGASQQPSSWLQDTDYKLQNGVYKPAGYKDA